MVLSFKKYFERLKKKCVYKLILVSTFKRCETIRHIISKQVPKQIIYRI